MPQAGQRVGEYVLEEPLGSGAFGQVWRARHHAWLDQIVAVKIPTDPQYLRNLQREGAAIQGIVHPNVARAIAFDPFADPAYLVTEYVPGSSLRPLIAKKSLGPVDAVAVMQQVLSGLKHAHGKGIVHRDVKPENILVHERAAKEGYATEGVVKLTDFGLGRAAGDAAMQSIAYSASLNDPKARELAGTLDYMPPEVRGGTEADARADIYACGVVLYEMLTGERPAGTDVPSEVNPNVPRHLDDVFRRAYARLEKRFTSADEFLGALNGQPSVALPGRAISTPTCPQCRKNVNFGDQFCMHCGIQLVAQVRRCARCGAYPDAADQYCIFCGASLTPQMAAAAT
jgi:serine/threonine protein kinase